MTTQCIITFFEKSDKKRAKFPSWGNLSIYVFRRALYNSFALTTLLVVLLDFWDSSYILSQMSPLTHLCLHLGKVHVVTWQQTCSKRRALQAVLRTISSQNNLYIILVQGLWGIQFRKNLFQNERPNYLIFLLTI